MWRVLKNRGVWIAGAGAAALVAVALWPSAVLVETGRVARTPLAVTIDEEGETRVRETFVVSAPVSGRLQRIDVEPGDVVRAGQVLTRVRPELAPLLDARTRADVEAALTTARATRARVDAEHQQALDALAHATRELQRTRDLIAAGLATQQALDARESEARAAADAADAAHHAVEAADSEVRRAAARLTPSRTAGSGRPVEVRSPIAGVVLRRLRESESVVPGGEPLLHIGDPRQLEIVADLLSTDAVRVAVGARVLVEQWGGDRSLEARVQRIEPAGFTKVSALGVEEQRVNVVCDFVDSRAAWAALGDAFRVEVRIVQWESSGVLTAPASALFRAGEGWSAYVIRDGRAHRTPVEVGHRTSQRVEVLTGLSDGDEVVVYPGDAVRDGVRVATAGAR